MTNTKHWPGGDGAAGYTADELGLPATVAGRSAHRIRDWHAIARDNVGAPTAVVYRLEGAGEWAAMLDGQQVATAASRDGAEQELRRIMADRADEARR